MDRGHSEERVLGQKQEEYTLPVRSADDGLVLTKDETSLADTIPNGGLIAWLQLVGSFFLVFNSW